VVAAFDRQEALGERSPDLWQVCEHVGDHSSESLPVRVAGALHYANEMPRFFVTQQIIRYFEVVADSGDDANKIVFERYAGDPPVDVPVASVRTEKYEISAVMMTDTQRAEQL